MHPHIWKLQTTIHIHTFKKICFSNTLMHTHREYIHEYKPTHKMYFLLYLFLVNAWKGTTTHTFPSVRFTEKQQNASKSYQWSCCTCKIGPAKYFKKTIFPTKTSKQNLKIAFQIRAAFYHMAEKHICKLGLPLWHISNFCHLLSTDMLKLLKNVFFLVMGKVFFTPHFQKQLEQFGIRNTSTSKGLPNSKRKVKRLGKRTSHWKSFLKMETLVQFQLPNTSIIMSPESEKFKSSLSSGHSGYNLKAFQFQSYLGKIRVYLNKDKA